MKPTLVTIGFSHFCEKARWALDRARIAYHEEAHAPLLHLAGTMPRGGRSTPLLRLPGGRSLTDSHDILTWIEDQRPGVLYPTEPAAREQVLALEARFDRELGPAARRIAYHAIAGARESIAPMLRQSTRGMTRALAPVIAPAVMPLIVRGLKIDRRGVARSREKLEGVLREVEALLSDGRRFLVGDRFTAADLTFAALYAPMVLPEGHPIGAITMSSLRALRDEAMARPAGNFASMLYATERGVRVG